MSVNAIFKETQVAGIEDVKPVRLTVEGLASEEMWLLDIKGETSPNYQLMYAVGNDAYLNAFNQRFSLFSVSGVHILSTCSAQGASGEPPFLKFYKNNNIVTGSSTTNITYSGITMKGYMVGLALGSYNQEGIDGYQFTLKYLAKLDALEAATAAAKSRGNLGKVAFNNFGGVTFNSPAASGNSVRAGKPSLSAQDQSDIDRNRELS
jgi:hypothetical protein